MCLFVDKVNIVARTRATPGLDWLHSLRGLASEYVFVDHVPVTPRYGRAAQKLRYLLRESSVLGQRRPPSGATDAVEIATWAPSPEGRGSGYYACFRVFIEAEMPTAAVLFCFYDGTDKCPGFKSIDMAEAYAASQGFEKTTDEQDRRQG